MTLKINARQWTITLLAAFCFVATACGVYSFANTSIPPDIKTVSVGFLGNKARYINPQLSPKLTDALVQKINSQTKLTRVENLEDGDYQISGYVSTYNVTTSGVSAQQASLNRLTVGVHINFYDKKNDKKQEFDVSRDFDFNASLSLTQAEPTLMDQIIKNETEEIFNKIFSNW